MRVIVPYRQVSSGSITVNASASSYVGLVIAVIFFALGDAPTQNTRNGSPESDSARIRLSICTYFTYVHELLKASVALTAPGKRVVSAASRSKTWVAEL